MATSRRPKAQPRARIAHSVRGRLRVRYPAAWLRGRRGLVEARLRRLPGVRAVDGNPVTGSVRILYDPFTLALEEIPGRHALQWFVDRG